jgi:hypothetical protein
MWEWRVLRELSRYQPVGHIVPLSQLTSPARTGEVCGSEECWRELSRYQPVGHIVPLSQLTSPARTGEVCGSEECWGELSRYQPVGHTVPLPQLTSPAQCCTETESTETFVYNKYSETATATMHWEDVLRKPIWQPAMGSWQWDRGHRKRLVVDLTF